MSFLPLSSLQLLSKRLPPTPVYSTIFRVSGHLLPVPKGRQVWGQGEQLSLYGILPWRLPNLVVFLPAFSSGETPERLQKSGRPLARLSRSKLSSHSPRATSLPRKRKEEAK